MQNNHSFDLLAELETPETTTQATAPIFAEPLAMLDHGASSLDILSHVEELPSFDPLATVEIIDTPIVAVDIASSTGHRVLANVKAGLKFLSHYVAVSSIVFTVLLIATNWSAYYAVALNYLRPEGVATTNQQIQSTLSNSKITVYANDGAASAFEKKEKAEDIKKQLEAENVRIDEEPFSMKNLIPAEPNISAKFDITPYENRIIIPRIGKNIPMVDISVTKSFDFDHMENIFMQELEKGVVRYPGSAVPGEKGNAFVFGHSSNYPWVKGDYNDVFALLDNVEYGDQIIVFYNQKKYVYTVSEKKIVKPGDVKALDRNPDKTELSLMTCWPIGTTLKRMLVFAELTESP